MLSLFSAVLLSISFVAARAPTVALEYGVFQGAVDGNLSTFLGVPFAQPAIRFSLPQTPKFLHGKQNATTFGPACPQQALDLPPLIPPNAFDAGTGAEDCLTLNVFAPGSATPRSKLPVLVWLFGGGFVVGSSADTDMRPTVERSIATGEPVIIVTPNYRVSAFGFLAGKEIGDAGVSNLGIRDQIFALEWVQQHIAAFGGDPRRVIIGGLSAGSISTAFLLMSNNRFEPTSLFRGAFMVSGSQITSGTVADGQPDYDSLVAVNNCTGSIDTLDCLRRVPFDAFKATVDNTTNMFSYSSLQLIWRPRVDQDVVVQAPLISVSEGSYAKVPFLTVDSDDEGTRVPKHLHYTQNLYFICSLFSLSTTNITTNDEFLDYLQSNYLPGSTGAQIAELGMLYPDDPVQGSPFDTGLANQLTPEFKRLAAFQGDYVFTGMRRFFLQHASRTQNTWSWLNKRGKLNTYVGAAHGSDISLWFPPANATDLIQVDALINFINTLDPNGIANSSTLFWPKWDNSSSDGGPLLLTLSDPAVVNITAEDFRVDAIGYLNNLLVKEAEEKAAAGESD
ncbi:carotenoid ester lipase precursor [Mycena vitilis]|nr:carotenoid ester lipase precursor [Mycena vitilis]